LRRFHQSHDLGDDHDAGRAEIALNAGRQKQQDQHDDQNLLASLHFGSMPHQLCLKNIDLFCRDVLPHLEVEDHPAGGFRQAARR